MRIGDVIRKYRKDAGMTQEEMANRLGVTAPAVNKWENNNSLPDVALLAPIARLLGISTDELLSFREKLTAEEINQFLSQIQKDLEKKDFDDVLLSAKTKIQEYPNCESLIWQTASILNARLSAKNPVKKGEYEEIILSWYERCLQSESEQIRSQAANSLFYFYYQRKDYGKALPYTSFFSRENPERKRKEALVYSKTGKKEAAYQAYEELLFSGYQHLQLTLNCLRNLYMEDGNPEMVHKLVRVSSTAAAIFEMGRYQEISAELDAAAWEKDSAKTAQIMRELWDNLGTVVDFTKSKLYQHMAFKAVEPEFTERFRKELLKSLEDESYGDMRGNDFWKELKAAAKKI